jgi:hypothetical protein
MLKLIETALTLAAVVVSLTAPEIGSRWFEGIEAGFRRVARRRTLSVLIVAAAALAARSAVFPVLPVPQPRVVDEYSHLLLADTLLHGRLANPTPPMWIHFETFDVNMLPTYASVYPPVQGFFLALGRLLTGRPFFGVMLSMAVMCGAICWMLQGWTSPQWALLGGMLVVLRFGVFSFWADSYMGAAPAAIGGALALGALPRIKRDFRARDAVILGLGLSIMANSRPYEGFILSLPIGFALLIWLLRQRGIDLRRALVHVVVPLLIVGAIAGIATGYYCWRLTGNPLLTPYQVNWRTYGEMPKFLWQALRPQEEASLRHEALKSFYYGWEYSFYTSTRTAAGLLTNLAGRVVQDWMFYLGPILALPLVAAIVSAPYGFRWRDLAPSTRFLLVAGAVFAAGLAVELFSFPQYAAPFTCAAIALVLVAMRYLRRQVHSGKRFGLFLTRAVPIVCLLMVALRALAVPLHIPLMRNDMVSNYEVAKDDTLTNPVDAFLEKTPGQHLVIVYVPPGAESPLPLVHNEADIDGSKIVWAWDMGRAQNDELINYFKGRRVWWLESGNVTKLSPYTGAEVN